VIAKSLIAAVLAAVACGCSSTRSSGGDAGSSGSAITPIAVGDGQGICAATCPRSCDSDGDCDTEIGDLCCNYGSSKVCTPAADCPIFCDNEAVCQRSADLTCVVTSLVSGTPSTCAPPGSGLQFCRSDSDCSGPSQTCCTNYDRPICTDSGQCPASCTNDAQCNALGGEMCCTSVQAVEPNLSAMGLCLNPTVQPCPQPCSRSSDCSDVVGASLCCNGLCAATCPTTCTQDSDCYQEICCKSPSLAVPAPPVLFGATPPCVGTLDNATCGECLAQLGACACPGCTADDDAGTCSGASTAPSCAQCGADYDCDVDYCPGCSLTTNQVCTGSPSYAPCGVCPPDFCGSPDGVEGCPGCTLGDGGCEGTVLPCGDNASEADCNNDYGCSWGGSACTGTITQCVSRTTAAACNGVAGCGWIAGGPLSCVGTPTPCVQLSAVAGDAGLAQCPLQPGCFVRPPQGDDGDAGPVVVAPL
jgi:hypothetical protein